MQVLGDEHSLYATARVNKEMISTIEIYIFIHLDIHSHKSWIRMD